jgi:type II secretory pathway component PulK
VDADDEGLQESSSYLKNKPPYACANRIFYDWAELLAVAGGQRAMFDHHPRESTVDTFNADLVDGLTICPLPRERPRPINVNTATPEALRGVMGVGQDDMVRTILALRSFKPIRSLATVLAVDDPDFAENVRPYLDVRSREFRVDASAYANHRAVSVRALAQRDSSGRVEIVQWIF